LPEQSLQDFCKKNFEDPNKIFSTLMEYKKILLDENNKMNLIGKSTINDF
jgi:16S rRNA G527 N7-methylase RsmG